MKKLFTLFFLVMLFNTLKAQYHVPCSDLFFSEYVSPQGTGTSGNKAIEIYNPSGIAINMSGYVIVKANNNCTQVQSFNMPPYNLASHSVYVINNGAGTVDPLVAAASDTTWSNLNFNGNDALYLINPSGDTLDIFGIICSNPTGGWPLGASGSITQYVTLVRNASVNNGDTSWNVVQNEWTIYPANTYSYLGSHTMNPCGQNPSVNFVTPLDTQLESAGLINIPVSITNANNDTSKVTVVVGIGSATQNSDFTYTTQTLIFPPNSSVPINDTLRIIDDLLVEGNETVTLQFINPTNNSDTLDKGIDSIYTLTIIDNDTAAQFSFTTPTYQLVNENLAPTLQLPIHLSTASASIQTIDIAVDIANSTTQPADYTFTNQTVSFTPGAQNINIPISIVNDCLQEGLETIIVHLTNATGGATIGVDSVFVIDIAANDTMPNVYFATPLVQSVNENVGTVSVAVKLDRAYCDTVLITIDTATTSTAYLGLDYNAISFPDTIIFYPGDTIKTITLNVIDDLIQEGMENITLSISNSYNAIATTTPAQIFIIDNDGPPTFQFNTAAISYSESAGTINIPVSILNPNANVSSICVYAVGGTATLGTDYIHPPQCISFAANSSSPVIGDTIKIVDDFLVEGNETVILKLMTPFNLSGTPLLGIDSVLTLTIIDNDTAPKLNFGLPKTINVNENVGTINVPVHISNTNFTGSFVFNVSAKAASTATLGADYTLATNTYTFASGNATMNIPLTIIDDCLPENTESIILHITSPTNGALIGIDSIYTININANDTMPVVSFNTPNTVSVNENIGLVSTTVSLSHAYCDTVKVFYNVGGTASNGLDYNNIITTNAVVIFPPGSTSKIIAVQIIDDFLVEPTESITFAISNANNASIGNSNHTINILDNDGASAPTVQFQSSALSWSENIGTVQIGVTITNPSTTATSVDVNIIGSSATFGVDFTALASQTLTFPANSTTTQYISVTIINDLLIEPSETFIATLTNPTNNAIFGVNSSFIGTILDDDINAGTPTLNFNTSSITVSESVGTVYLPITITNSGSLPLAFAYTLGGVATTNIDYIMVTNSPATVVAGVGSTNLQLNIFDDAQVESTEDIIVTLIPTSNCIVGVNSTTTVYITNNDNPPPPMGINIVNGADAIKIYPNPIDAKGILKIIGIEPADATIELYNILGSKIIAVAAEKEINLANYNLNNGFYFYKIISKQGLIKEGKILLK
ncbi:MAG: hypothetical protein RJA07_2000 [Bacteroidota bacterium]|jgi:hypothetical protein